MTLQGGDREYGHADNITMTFDNSNSGASTANEGEAASVTGDLTFDLSDSGAGQPSHGVLSDQVDNGNDIGVHLHGAVWARVDDADNASGGDTVGAGTTDGVLTTSGSDFLVLVGETSLQDGNTYALVYLD